ncbi:hypothetical protein IAR55_006356 [Kwoniella newhampshirensis]|uniref:SnoaL-like domain-containing protein n=1 Tax=Kwoniella newhampshirensis TaxID=1651941 RepID=A0AAW0YFV1_9TREE
MTVRRQFVFDFVRAIDEKRLDEIKGYFDDKFLYHPHPIRLGSFGKPERMTGDDFVCLLAGLTSLKRWNESSVLDPPMKLIESDKSMLLHMSATPKHVSGKTFQTEYVYMLDFGDDGKITELNEFFDTAYIQEMSAL